MKSSVFPLIFVRVVAATVSCPSVDTWSRQRAELTRLLASHLWDGNIHHADLVVFSVPTLTAFPPQQSCVLFWWAVSFVLFCFFFPFVDRSKIASTYYWHQSHTSVKPHTSGSKSAILFVCLAVGDTTTNTLLSLSDSGWNIQLLFFLLFFLCGGGGEGGVVLKGNVL